MSAKLSSAVLDAVERILSDAVGLTPAEIHRRLGMWARPTVRQALQELIAAGRATFEGPDRARSYRRRPTAAGVNRSAGDLAADGTRPV